jgi:hypothetical protein
VRRVNTFNARRLAVVFASLFFVVIIGDCSGGGSTSTASSAKAITAFSFLTAENAIPVDSQATISGTAIQAFLPPAAI